MKFLKTFLLIGLITITALSSACFGGGQSVNTNMFAGSYWLKSADASGVSKVDETCVYNVSFLPIVPEDSSTQILTSDLTGTLTTVLSTTVFEGEECYKFTTSTQITGNYYYEGQTHVINDISTSEAYFLGLSNKLTPLYSKKYVLSTIPIISPLNETAVFAVMEYSTETKYDRAKGQATVTVKGGDKSTENYKVDDSEKVYEDYAKSGSFIDNETLLFIPRAADFADHGFSSSFNTIDALAGKIQPMRLTVDSSAATGEIELPSYEQAGVVTNKKITVYNAAISIASNFSGSALKLYYATDTTKEHRRLVKYQTELAFKAGNIVYTLSSVTYS